MGKKPLRCASRGFPIAGMPFRCAGCSFPALYALLGKETLMQKLCFKLRKGARTVQLVRHAYSSIKKRSCTVTLGSFPTDADPEDFRPDLKLGAGVTLSEEELEQVGDWLRQHGDPAAAGRRRAAAECIEAKVRASLLAASASGRDAFDRAVGALDEAGRELPGMAGSLRAQGEDVWKHLRPRYLEMFSAWERFQKAAQASGVMKRMARSGTPEEEDI